MEIIHSIILATIQGLTEFLPISSSGHLVLLPWIMKFKDPGLAFNVLLHTGTSVALIAYFWQDLINIIKGFFSIFFKKINSSPNDKKLAIMIIIGTIPAGICGILFEELIEQKFRSPISVALALIIVGILIELVDRKSKQNIDVIKLSFLTALWIGCFQILALIPGVSRSGITILAGLLFGLKRDASARFSFLLSMPAIIGATLLKSKNIIELATIPNMAIPSIIGFLTAVVTGYITIVFLLNYLKNHRLTVFVVYRIILGVTIITLIMNGFVA